MVDTSDDWIVQRTGIDERRLAAPGEATSDLAIKAARNALAAANLPAEALEAIILATMTPDQTTPAAAVHVQHALGARRAAAFDINAACSGFVYAVTVGAAFVRSGIFRHVLVIGSECNSRLINWHDRNTCILFGDGAGAAVLSGFPGNGDSGHRRLGAGVGREQGRFHNGARRRLALPGLGGDGARRPSLHDAQRPRGFQVRRHRHGFDGRADPGAQQAHHRRHTADHPHQVNSRIVSACCERIGVPLDRFYLNIDRYGNTSAASVPIALDEACRAGLINRGDFVCLLAFGAGMTWGYTLVQW